MLVGSLASTKAAMMVAVTAGPMDFQSAATRARWWAGHWAKQRDCFSAVEMAARTADWKVLLRVGETASMRADW